MGKILISCQNETKEINNSRVKSDLLIIQLSNYSCNATNCTSNTSNMLSSLIIMIY